MKVCLTRIIFFLSFLIVRGLSAQSSLMPYDSTYYGNILRTNFTNDINLAGLNTLFNYSTSYDNIGVVINEYFQSNVSKLERNFSRDFNNFKAIVYYRVNENFNSGAGIQNIFLTDDKNIETNRNNSTFLFSNFDYFPLQEINSNLRIGYKREDQIGEINSGLSGIFTANANNFFIKDYMTNGQLVLAYEDLGGKKSHDYDIAADVFKVFSEAADNTGTIRYYSASNDFFFPASQTVANEFGVKNNKETRAEDYFFIGDGLNYRLNEYSGVSIAGNYFNRIVKKEYEYRSSSANALLDNLYDTKIVENNLELSASLDFTRYLINANARLFYVERSENHSLLNISGLSPSQINELEKAEKNKNNNSRRTGLFGELRYSFSNTNYFAAAGSASLLKYDTDLEDNYDDRDEFEMNMYLLHGYSNLRNFEIQTKFDYINSSLSYIYSQRSANNYKNKIYRLSSLSNFSPVNGLVTRNFLQVLANYTVYDFEDIVSQVQSFSYRQLSIRDSTSYLLMPEFEILFTGELKLYEQGQFNNGDFTVKPINYFEEQFYSPELIYSPYDLLKFSAGFRYFQQIRYRYDNTEKSLAGIYRSYGPYGKIFLYLNRGSIVNLTGGLDFIRNSIGGFSDESFNLSMNLLWNI